MKKSISILLIIISSICIVAQENKQLPDVSIYNETHTDSTQLLDMIKSSDHEYTIIYTWASWCKPAHVGIANLQEDYQDRWITEFNTAFLFLSIDDERSYQMAIDRHKKLNFPFELLFVELNSDHEFRFAETCPKLIIANKKGEILHITYGYDSFDEIESKLKELSKSK